MNFKNLTFYLIPLVFFGVILQLTFYSGGSIILGGEGNFFIDFKEHSSVYGSTWFDTGYGWPNVIPNPVGVNNLILISISNFFDNYRIVNFILIFSIYASAYISFLILSSYIGLSRQKAIIISILYAVGPFSINYLQALNQWNVFSISIMPLLYYLVLKYSSNRVVLFFAIGIVTRVFSFSLYNPPTAVVVLSVIFLAGIHSAFIEEGFLSRKLIEYIKITLVSIMGFILFNLDWLAVLFYSIQNNYIAAIFTPEFATNWAESVSNESDLLLKALSFRQIIASNTNLDVYYSSPFIVIFLYGLSGLIFIKSVLNKNKLSTFFAFLIIFLVFLTKGMSNPFGSIYFFLMENLPFFYIFKTPTEKFGLLLNFIFFISASILILESKRVLSSTFLWILLVLSTYPVIFMNGIAATSNDGNYQMSRKHLISNDDFNVMTYLSQNYANMRVLTLPGGLNYQVMIKSPNGFYTGLDPILNNSNISYIYPGLDSKIYMDIFSSEWIKRLQDRDISAIFLNNKEIPWFGNEVKESLLVLRKHFRQIGIEETIIGDYYIWHIPNSNKRLSFEKY